MNISWTEAVNLATAFASLMLMITGLLVSLIFPGAEKKIRHFFIVFFFISVLYVSSNLITHILMNYSHSASATQLFLFLESFFSSLLMPLLTQQLLHCCRLDWRKHWLFWLVGLLWLLYFGLLLVTQFTTFIYYFTPENDYHRGPLYPLLLVSPALIMALNLFVLLCKRKLLSKKQFKAFLIYFFMPLLTMIIQMLTFGLLPIVFGTSVAAIALLLYILTEQVELYVRQKEELARQRESIMVLQMRPHFIYNTLISIYYLCGEDTQKAQQVILDFTSYLRKNFTAIAKEGTIPFEEELEHTRAYLAVEQVRFEEQLTVSYDTPHTQFRLPPLTLQPIVENAVKHGVDPELGPLHISISTRETLFGSEILVEDNGPGYRPTGGDTPHIALANIRERLETLCRGRLDIRERDGGGTSVKVVIPRERKNKAKKNMDKSPES